MAEESEAQVQSQPPPASGADSQDAQMHLDAPPTEPAAMHTNRKRPRIDLTIEPRERKRGKTAFGLLVGTLTKAKTEDQERNASDAAKKRQLIEQKLQEKLRKETDTVRRAEEAKKDKTSANRKEEELQLKDSIHKLRRTRLPLLANFLLTSDQIPTDETDTPPTPTNPLAPPPRSHPPPLFYLPVILTPSQEAFLFRRKAEVKETAEKEWSAFAEERTTGIEEITVLRRRVAEEEARKKAHLGETNAQRAEKGEDQTTAVQERENAPSGDADAEMAPALNGNGPMNDDGGAESKAEGMDVDETERQARTKEDSGADVPGTEADQDKDKDKDEDKKPTETATATQIQMQADEDDAVEY